ncbi:anti-sigma factor family protein [Kaarinaea lacus]
MIVTDKLSTESFHAFIDEQLTDEQYAQVEAQLDEIPEKIEEIQQCHIINERLREVFDPIVEEPIPDDLYELGLYGLGYDQDEQEQSGGDFDDSPMSYLELEEDIAAIDSLDIFPGSEDESFIDDTDASDLELLAQTEHLSDFDIDNLRHDPANIIPDIFDEAEADTNSYADAVADYNEQETEDSDSTDPADDLLESIDTLSMELEKAQHNKQAQQQAEEFQAQHQAEEIAEEPDAQDESHRNLLSEIDTESLELEPLDEEESADLLNESQLLQEEPGENEEQTAKEKVLETLSTEEELTLEPLEDQSNDAFIQELELSAEEETKQHNRQQNKSARPRNIREDQVVKENNIHPSLHESVAEPATENAAAFDFDSSIAKNNVSSNNEESLPEDLVAEFFSENKGSDFEVNEVVKQFEEVSVNFGDIDDGHMFDEGPFANIKYKAQEFVNVASSRINDIKTVIIRKKTEIIGRFGGGDDNTDFNKAPFGDFSQPLSSSAPAVDALDLSAFDDFADEPKSKSPLPGGPEELSKASRDDDKGEDYSNTLTFNAEDMNSGSSADSMEAQDLFSSFDNKPQTSAEVDAKRQANPEAASSGVPDFNMNFGIDDAPEENNLVNKIGDTLRRYKQKITEMRATAADEADNLDEATSGVEKYKNIAGASLGNFEFIKNAKVAIAGVLVAGLLLGGIVVFLTSGSGDTINNNSIEKLAIDTHLLNSQFSTKIVADADSAIIEKLQWFSARVGRQVRLADIRIEDFVFKKVTVIPTMASFAATNIFENKAGQRITLLAIADLDGVPEVPISCRIPPEVDGLCSWVKASVRYIAVANLSLSRVRSFSEQVIENL